MKKKNIGCWDRTQAGLSGKKATNLFIISWLLGLRCQFQGIFWFEASTYYLSLDLILIWFNPDFSVPVPAAVQDRGTSLEGGPHPAAGDHD